MSPEKLAARAAEYGYKSLALTDTSDLGGSIRFTLEAERVGIKPIIGAELLIDGFTTVLIARDARGYRNLAELVSRARVGELRDWMLADTRFARARSLRERMQALPGGLRDARLAREDRTKRMHPIVRRAKRAASGRSPYPAPQTTYPRKRAKRAVSGLSPHPRVQRAHSAPQATRPARTPAALRCHANAATICNAAMRSSCRRAVTHNSLSRISLNIPKGCIA